MDDLPETLQFIEDGVIAGVKAQRQWEIGYWVVKYLVALNQNHTIPHEHPTGSHILTKEQRRILLGETVAPHRFGRWLLRASARGGAKGFRRGWRWLLLGRVAVSFEDWRLDTPALVGWPKARRDILIVRDPFNLFASRIQMRGGGHRNLGDVRADP